MVRVSLRHHPARAAQQNAVAVATRPVSGTPLWARAAEPGRPRPASPWDAWSLPATPRHPHHAPTGPRSRYAGPGLRPAATFRPWRVDTAEPDRVHSPPEDPAAPAPPPGGAATAAKRLLRLLGLVYFLVAALASGLAHTGFFAESDDRDDGTEPDGTEPDRIVPPARPPARDPHAPGLHTRPDGTRYLVMPLPADAADRLRGRVQAVGAAPT